MATINRFEDIIGWQKERALCKLINAHTQNILFAKGSAGEIRSQLYRFLDYESITKDKFQ
ncbi:MAG: hypothetical protein HN778_08185 [Prolixibacteraceae bacterium]|jgi:hypothetical protein|nr:hypothetical protein [Prolixibacteraceae bacterium]MBT6006972.1 hypothetical protein [Prolixibacteraceae bacterium]MBT6765944.1 hypothetical protein [Prolixibacteraceae bacterium]MBT6999449.1 hypothetical protein [Prolixibacteraceae bacterium]MBT7394796.1 hypothetical protein [Prolixibacteraceae bacterium]